MKNIIMLAILSSTTAVAAQTIQVYPQKQIVCVTPEQCFKTDSGLRKKFLKFHPDMDVNSFQVKDGTLYFQYRFDKIALGKVISTESDRQVVELASSVVLQASGGDVKKRKERQVNDLGGRYTAYYWTRTLGLSLTAENRKFEMKVSREDLRIDPFSGVKLPIEEFRTRPMTIVSSTENGLNEYIGDNKPENPACAVAWTDEKTGEVTYRNGRNELIDAIRAIGSKPDSLQKIITLIEAGAEVNYKVPEFCGKYFRVQYEAGSTPLHVILRTQSMSAAEVVSALLKKGADVNARTSLGTNAFFEIKTWGHPSHEVDAKIMHLFLDYGFDADEKGRFSGDYIASYIGGYEDPLNTEIHKSEINGIIYAVQLLRNPELLLPLVKRMIEKADINFQMSNGVTALDFLVGATGDSTKTKVKFFIDNGANLQLRDRLGRRACEITPKYNAEVKALVCQ